MQFNKGYAVAAAGAVLLAFTAAGSAQERGQPAARPAMQVAQIYSNPPADVGRGQDEASLLIRIERLENQLRQMTGQIEQVQNENHRLEEQLRKFQQDVEFRFQEGGSRVKTQKRGEVEPQVPTQTAGLGNDQTIPTTPPTVPPHPNRRSDAFDPTADPNAPGAPRNLGTAPTVMAPDRPGTEERDPSAPLDLSSSPSRTPKPLGSETATNPQLGSNPAQTTTPGGTVIANTQPNAPPINPVKEEFDLALGYLKQKQYEAAEKGFVAFLQKNPKTRYSAEAIYYLGETFYQRGRQREAAEQYLKISTDYASSNRAPEALVRLGQSLHAIGAKEQACASFSEVGRRYPNASAAVKAAAEREAKRYQC